MHTFTEDTKIVSEIQCFSDKTSFFLWNGVRHMYAITKEDSKGPRTGLIQVTLNGFKLFLWNCYPIFTSCFHIFRRSVSQKIQAISYIHLPGLQRKLSVLKQRGEGGERVVTPPLSRGGWVQGGGRRKGSYPSARGGWVQGGGRRKGSYPSARGGWVQL